ncbi:hypothetical protein H8959_021249 [Pygathrix nigripes]
MTEESAAGEGQRLLVEAYGEGSGADCRRHVQKLNLLQGQVSELPLSQVLWSLQLDGWEGCRRPSEDKTYRPVSVERPVGHLLTKPSPGGLHPPCTNELDPLCNGQLACIDLSSG